jgi:hypothetical protein
LNSVKTFAASETLEVGAPKVNFEVEIESTESRQ